jgi:hypothetical protein
MTSGERRRCLAPKYSWGPKFFSETIFDEPAYFGTPIACWGCKHYFCPTLNQHPVHRKLLQHFFFHCLPLPGFLFFQNNWVTPKHICAHDCTHFGCVMDGLLEAKLSFFMSITYPKYSWFMDPNVSGLQKYVSGLHQTHINQASRQIWENKCNHTFVIPAFKTCCWFNLGYHCSLLFLSYF